MGNIYDIRMLAQEQSMQQPPKRSNLGGIMSLQIHQPQTLRYAYYATLTVPSQTSQKVDSTHAIYEARAIPRSRSLSVARSKIMGAESRHHARALGMMKQEANTGNAELPGDT